MTRRRETLDAAQRINGNLPMAGNQLAVGNAEVLLFGQQNQMVDHNRRPCFCILPKCVRSIYHRLCLWVWVGQVVSVALVSQLAALLEVVLSETPSTLRCLLCELA